MNINYKKEICQWLSIAFVIRTKISTLYKVLCGLGPANLPSLLLDQFSPCPQPQLDLGVSILFIFSFSQAPTYTFSSLRSRVIFSGKASLTPSSLSILNQVLFISIFKEWLPPFRVLISICHYAFLDTIIWLMYVFSHYILGLVSSHPFNTNYRHRAWHIIGAQQIFVERLNNEKGIEYQLYLFHYFTYFKPCYSFSGRANIIYFILQGSWGIISKLVTF